MPPPKKAKDAPKIDTTGEFPSGETYADFTGFKQVIRDTRADLEVPLDPDPLHSVTPP